MCGDIVHVSLKRRIVKYADGSTVRIESLLDIYGFDARTSREVVSFVTEEGESFHLSEVEDCLVG
ncbi:hypothetical protein FHV99_004657 [Ochrobactrum sp. P20RRXII]|nr:hypothetical protein [Ochrobactrum sp. P20RRXII]NIH77405.1 hypothetical protein [Ochrobactrum sp. P20RRXII]